MANAVEASGISKRFGKTQALDSLSLAVPKGAFCVVAGPNGSGKTTLLSIVAGTLRPDSGKLSVDGPVGYCNQSPLLYEDLSVAQNLEIFSRMIEPAGEEPSGHIGLLGLRDCLRTKAGDLSPGIRKKVELAVSLIGNPDVMILDEPTTGLDRKSSEGLLSFLKGLCGKKTLLVATHQLSDFDGLCTHLVILRKGRKIYEGKPSSGLEKTYWKRVGGPRTRTAGP